MFQVKWLYFITVVWEFLATDSCGTRNLLSSLATIQLFGTQ